MFVEAMLIIALSIRSYLA